MTPVLKILRLIILIVAWYQVVAMLPAVTWIGNVVSTEMWVGLILKVFFAVMLFAIAFGLKRLISKVYREKIAA